MLNDIKKNWKAVLIIIATALIIIFGLILACASVEHANNERRYDSMISTSQNKQYKLEKRNDIWALKHRKPSCNHLALEANNKHHKTIYKKSKDGNYWSYFKNHVVPGHNNSVMHATDTVNGKILEKHGVTSGPNF